MLVDVDEMEPESRLTRESDPEENKTAQISGKASGFGAKS